jgi:hypothetical protein
MKSTLPPPWIEVEGSFGLRSYRSAALATYSVSRGGPEGAAAWDHRGELVDVVAGPQSCDRDLVGWPRAGEQLGRLFEVVLVAGRRDQEEHPLLRASDNRN